MFQRLPARLAGVLLAAFLTACSSGLAVRSDVDPNADFRRYSTWDFFEVMGVEGGNNSPVFGEYFREAITREMTGLGYRRSADPDLLVNVTMRGDDKVKMTSYTEPYVSGAYYRRPGSRYYGSSVGVGVATSSRPAKVLEASIFVDLVDSTSNRMVWQGVAVADASDSAAKRLRDAIHTAVNRVFELYPQTPGRP